MAAESPRGTVVAIGGHEGQAERGLLERLLRIVPGGARKVVVVPAASKLASEVGRDYEAAFRTLGTEAYVLGIHDREDAESPASVRRVAEADLVFLTGGDQLRLTSLLGGTAVHRAIRGVLAKGGVVAGTSAGAACMSGTMIVDGDSRGIRRGNVQMAPGLDLVSGCVIDTHFLERGRLTRLLEVVAANPGLLGLGVGEDTAMLVQGTRIESLGRGLVVVVDGHDVRHTNISDVGTEGQVAIENAIVHTLPDGYAFDLARREYTVASDARARRTAATLEEDLEARDARVERERDEIAQRDREAAAREREAGRRAGRRPGRGGASRHPQPAQEEGGPSKPAS
jgi:cyanophycinase